jgi:transcriptional regulator with PAS, ATPase and Fis domain
LQDTLLESELFGYEAGAFSGAKGRKLGLFELADGGTLFLDEVTELPPSLQAKLLRALETSSFYRVGGTRKVEINVRIVAATNRDPEEAMADKSLRADLLYRLSGFQIALAPLRERREDIIPLAQHLLAQLTKGAPYTIEEEVFAALRTYHWPGNVRQLRNCLERAWLLAEDSFITLDELPPEVVKEHRAGSISNDGAELLASHLPASAPLREVEKSQIVAALEQTNWHRGRTAKLLGISASTLYRRLREYGLDLEEESAACKV